MQSHSPVRLCVFDLDGTLVDSRRDLATAANALVLELGGSPLTEEAVGGMVGEGAAVLVTRALVASGLDPATPGALARFLRAYDEHLLDSTRPYEGIDQALAILSSRMPLAVLTNKPQAATERIVEAFGWRRFFGAVIGGDTELGRKPDPAGLLHTSRMNGVDPSHTLLVGDSPVDLETARRAGAMICLAAYGFGYRAVPLGPRDMRVSSASELTDLF